MNKPSSRSLKHHLIARLLMPLLAVLILGALGAFTLAREIGTRVHDNWLLDSAMSLSEQVRIQKEKAVRTSQNRPSRCSNGINTT